jgi:hypothetical protein
MIFYGITQPSAVTIYPKYAGLVNSSIGSMSVEKDQTVYIETIEYTDKKAKVPQIEVSLCYYFTERAFAPDHKGKARISISDCQDFSTK